MLERTALLSSLIVIVSNSSSTSLRPGGYQPRGSIGIPFFRSRTVEMIGPSRSAGAGRDALRRVRRRASIKRNKLGKKETRASEKGLQRLADAQRRSRGSATLPRHSCSNASLVARASVRFPQIGWTRPLRSHADRSQGQPLFALAKRLFCLSAFAIISQ